MSTARNLFQALGAGDKGSGSDEAAGKFGTFGGVFSPTVLTILGVIMYLRLGWVVGNAGLLGAIAIILLAKSITICTGLSMASITTNIKIGAGGAYSIISKSLGLETGGSIGIPFFVSQTLSAALYIIGFTEGWRIIFPDHPTLLIALITWAILMAISYISTEFAIRIQYIIMALIALSLVSFLMMDKQPMAAPPLIGDFEDAGFWAVFAIFFPAVTGIMAGANMSGDLKDPRRSITYGTLWGIALTLIVYIGLTVFMAYYLAPSDLRSNQMVMVDSAYVPALVTIGILAATFSSALGSILGAPRILQALAAQGTVPFSEQFAKKTKSNEPRNAIVFTGVLIVAALIPGNLDFLATLITMFFLVTYGMLNLVVFIQQSMNIISFRPTFKIPRIVSLFGGLGCIFMMFLINAVFSAVAIAIIIFLYTWLTRKELKADWGDIRGGMFMVLAERASRVAARFPRHQVSWKPDLLIPINNPQLWAGPLLFIRDITHPSGSVYGFTVKEKGIARKGNEIEDLFRPLKEEGIFVYSTVIDDGEFIQGTKHVIQTLKGAAFSPNTLFLILGNNESEDDTTRAMLAHATQNELATIILNQHPRTAFGMQKTVNLWLREKSPNWHLGVLIALQLQLNWEGTLNLIATARDESERTQAKQFLERLNDQARLPARTNFKVVVGSFEQARVNAPRADINIFGLGEESSLQFVREATQWSNSSCLFVKDSGWESAIV